MEEERLRNLEEGFKPDGDENRDGGENGANGGLGVDDDNELPPLVRAIDIPALSKMIVSHLEEVSDLKNLRLVSKRWMDVSLDKWRKTAVFSLTNDAAHRALKLTLGIDDGPPSLEPTFTIYSFHDKPFTQYRLKKGEIFPPDLPAIQDQLFFWEQCGPFIKYLDLPECYFKKNLYFEGLNWILRSCPNLEELDFAPFKENDGSDNEDDVWEATLWHEYDDKDWEGFEESVLYRIPNNEIEGDFPGGVTQVGDRLKSLTISSTNIPGEINGHLFATNVPLATSFFGLIPNLTTLTIKNLVSCVPIMAALYGHAKDSAKGLRPIINLKKFVAVRTHFGNFIKYLTNYSPELKTFQYHQLRFMEILEDHFQLRKTLKVIKEHVEEIDFSLHCDDSCEEKWSDLVFQPLKPNSCFDLFNLRFPQLTKLSLVFEYSSDDHAKFFSFDFGMLRGTPNLKYFRFGASKDLNYSSNFVVEKLRLQDLVKKKEQSWHMVDGEERLVPNGFSWIQVEGEEPFLPDEEIILEKMEEFHYEGAFNAEALRFLGGAMKNLKVLGTVLDNETFSVPFQVWGEEKLRKVTALTMTKDALEDSVIAEQQKKYSKVEIVKLELPQLSGWISLSSKELEALPMRPTYLSNISNV